MPIPEMTAQQAYDILTIDVAGITDLHLALQVCLQLAAAGKFNRSPLVVESWKTLDRRLLTCIGTGMVLHMESDPYNDGDEPRSINSNRNQNG